MRILAVSVFLLAAQCVSSVSYFYAVRFIPVGVCYYTTHSRLRAALLALVRSYNRGDCLLRRAFSYGVSVVTWRVSLLRMTVVEGRVKA